VTTRGLVYEKDSEDFLRRLDDTVQSAMRSVENKEITEVNRIRNQLRDTVNNFVWREMKKNPVIIPIVMTVN
jgi:ribonuclease J